MAIIRVIKMHNPKKAIIFTPSDQQQEHLDVVVSSILSNISNVNDVDIILFTNKINRTFKNRHNLIIKKIDKKDLRVCEDIYFKEGRSDIPSFSAYAQFFIPDYFREYDHLLYLEVDQFVKSDLAILFNECIGMGYKLAAGKCLNHRFKPVISAKFNRLRPRDYCFNTGVLFLDTVFCIENDFKNRCIREALIQKKNKGSYYDFFAQGAINLAFYEDISTLDWTYNATGFGHLKGISSHVIDRAKIIHWTGTKKPWKNDGLYRELYSGNHVARPEDHKRSIIYYLYLDLRGYILKLKRFLS